MKRPLFAVVRGVLATLYGLIKALTRVNPRKVLFLGRRHDEVSPDFRLVIAELRQRDPRVAPVVLTMHMAGGLGDLARFAPLLLTSLYHLATAKVCVLDSYWPTVSILTHRDDLVVYQLWHSLGKVKQSGRQSLGRAQGRSEQVATGLRMHEGYDYVVAGAPAWNEQYQASFGVRPEQILNIGLPRGDSLVNGREATAARIRAAYPALAQRPVVLYVPTFRRGEQARGALSLAAALEQLDVELVVKPHINDHLIMPPQPHLTCPEFTGTELLTVADHVITDYSSIAVEAALIGAKTYYYLYDHEHYLSTNGVNLDLEAAMPGCVFTDAEDLARALQGDYPQESLRAYRSTYVQADPGHSTADLVDHLIAVGGLRAQ